MADSSEALDIIDQLKEQLGGGHGFFSKKPDLDLCADLVERLSRVIPDALSDADYVKNKRKDILNNADVVAKNTIRAAEEQAQRLVSESEVVRAAQVSAKQIIENAYAQCDNLILRTKSHLDGLFKETEQFLLSTLSVVRTNREELRNALTDNNGN